MTQTMKSQQPIGYWLKRVDNLLTEQIDKVQTANGVSRSDWQVLNTLYESGHLNRERIFETMRVFVDESRLAEILTRFVERGWVVSVGGRDAEEFQLTEEGRSRHAAILTAQKEVRNRLMQGIQEEEYLTVIRVLQQMAANLEEYEG